ncbi:hypothetical protein [Rhodoblastus sp.]|uniref:hypothetical protein n=1 Tax=Rhodoblastus sp. TaxID=1962975 RepID=UPI00260E3C4C|nr:hypothetical protein [Rhodoblastus sp.]
MIAVYTHDNFTQIAAAIGVEVEEIANHVTLFEAAARWYRLDSASPKRSAPSTLCRKLDRISKNACRLLRSLGLADVNKAVDGPGDPQILDALILLDDDDATPVTRATQRVARLVEFLEGVAAAAELSRRAEQAALEVAKVGKMTVEEGNHGDLAINDWLAAMMSVYKVITRSEPGTSVRGPHQPNEGIADGPLIRFLMAASKPLQLELSEDAWRSRVRTVLKCASLPD